MTLRISKTGSQFMVDDTSRSGSPIVGYGRTMKEAIGDYFHSNQSQLHIVFEVDETVRATEMRRRSRELRKR
jgi:hypothetical protein